MKHLDLSEEDDSNSAACSLTDIRAEFLEEGFDIAPLDVCTCRVCEQQAERALVLPLHGSQMVPEVGTWRISDGQAAGLMANLHDLWHFLRA